MPRDASSPRRRRRSSTRRSSSRGSSADSRGSSRARRRQHEAGEVGPLVASRYAIVLGVDGVLLKRGKLIYGADKAVQRLCYERVTNDGRKELEPRVPLIFVSNTCGRTEAEMASVLSSQLGIHVSESTVVLGHTPMKTLAAGKMRDSRLLIVGKANVARVAQSYGFTNFVTVQEFAEANPTLFRHKKYRTKANPPKLRNADQRFEAILVFEVPEDWGEAIQICTDLLISTGHVGKRAQKQVVKLYFSDPSVTHIFDYRKPRFSQGAFKLCLMTMYKTLTQQVLLYVQYGKPNETTYRYVESVIEEMMTVGHRGAETRITTKYITHEDGTQELQAKQEDHTDVRVEIRKLPPTIYTIGDTPHTDVPDDSIAGKRWHSILTLEGGWQEETEGAWQAEEFMSASSKAKFLADNLKMAVDYVLERHDEMPKASGVAN